MLTVRKNLERSKMNIQVFTHNSPRVKTRRLSDMDAYEVAELLAQVCLTSDACSPDFDNVSLDEFLDFVRVKRCERTHIYELCLTNYAFAITQEKEIIEPKFFADGKRFLNRENGDLFIVFWDCNIPQGEQWVEISKECWNVINRIKES
jgi:hypothetical protein